MNLLKAISVVYDKVYQQVKPYAYAKKIGVNIAKNVRFTGTIRWGTEPWLISVGGGTLLAHNVSFTTHDGAVHVVNKEETYKDVVKFGRIDVGENCFIGAGARIMPDVIVGDNSIIGADSLVTKDIPAGEVWAGNPARFICTTKQYAEKMLAKTPSYDVINLENNIREESLIIANRIRENRLGQNKG